MTRPHIYGYETVCHTRGCVNENRAVQIPAWDGNPIWCGACSQPINAEPACWHVPPTAEELGLPSPPEQAADLIANMTPEERAALIALLAEPDEEETP